MTIQQFIDKMTIIQNKIVEFIENDDNIEENFQNIIETFNNYNIQNNKKDLKMILYLILSVSNNHHRKSNFFNKISQILIYIKNQIIQYFSDYDLFEIFKKNKRVLLILFEEKIVEIDDYIVNQLTKMPDYEDYFSNEIIPLNKMTNSKFSIHRDNNFDRNRDVGENTNKICEIIRKDALTEFIEYIKLTELPLNSTIEHSIFETNPFINKKDPSIIEYAAFYGSINIFNYLRENQIKLTPNLWIYVIHSNNFDMIKALEDNKVLPENNNYKICLAESIKCSHTDLTNYFKHTYFNDEIDEAEIIVKACLKHRNFTSIPPYFDQNSFTFYYLCKYDYFDIVNIFLKQYKLNVRTKKIFNHICFFSYSF